MILTRQHLALNDFEYKYSKNTPDEHRKKYAQFFTPFPIAAFMENTGHRKSTKNQTKKYSRK